LWRFDETKELYQRLEATLKKENRFEGYGSTVDLLDNFTRFMGTVTKISEAQVFWSILYFSWYVTSFANLNKILEEYQVRHLNKLDDYVRILVRIPLLLEKAGITKITVEQVMT
jgi:hypothetical protein